jgi:hypothetical protein
MARGLIIIAAVMFSARTQRTGGARRGQRSLRLGRESPANVPKEPPPAPS